ncbi:tRNA (adenosine(37)-N6)-threonylcarbamoyltransferase complex ATPase subunit type 1 TsaE [Flaviaesturariibacter aridisoli]|uniref:tRNA threonylcarbamoyladenosine biosynthesis protein TsaE n=1 Tax=Flaviaesturariibacter aridisoli TaxID=2545761 RepID=A0A4R4E7C2_9BACT|nr:tRNA (adenosine(37)-N6)-threonylcarbamoyltransferase complex ATPase subunit type 1 TsaE [Flaviaesturariibacter aridisoli]TCZ74823.1 tRNA (adenosine(37)-N6)-threonylcarbamoyltransferase complex ATPase subunit type 1 TsaE [Flaviaesturariibacter aridisoli]
MTIDYRLDELPQLARRFWEAAGAARVFAFYGPMGAGKTTTIAALCAARGVASAVSSPTFSIINEYGYQEDGQPRRLYHMDLYRLRDADEAINAGVEDALESGALCFVEWPEKAPELLEDALRITIEVTGPQMRRMTIG